MGPVSRLFLPPPALSGCVFAAVYRDTRGARLCDADRVNHFPASPLVSATRVSCGELRLLPAGRDWSAGKDTRPLPSLFVMGPQDAPVSSWAPADVTAVSVGIYHDAWLLLGGDADFARAPACLVDALDRHAAAQDPETGWRVFCHALSAVWSQRRPSSWHDATGIADWARAVVTRAALSGTGRSLRSVERRIKRTGGQTRRALDFYSAFENLQRFTQRNAGRTLADIAAETGYTDQSHMGRAVRRATGFSPARLNRAIETEEAFWCYRLLGERF